MNPHARLAPSAATRWARCPGSVRMSEAIPPRKPGRPAMVGTLMHKVFELCLKGTGRKKNAVAFLGLTSDEDESVVFDEEMAEWVQSALNWVHKYLNEHGGKSNTEMHCHVGRALDPKLEEDCYGTADWVNYNPEELVVLDLKGGYVFVDVEDNYQLLLYAIGAVHHYEALGKPVEHIRLVIAQPRAGGNKEFQISREDLDDYQKFFRARAFDALKPNAPLNASEVACEWCAAAGTCPEAHKLTLELAKQADWPEVVPSLSDKELTLILEKAPMVRKLLDRAEEVAIERLVNGEKVRGFKLVESRRLRQWADETRALRWLTENDIEPFDEKLITPAAAERALGDELPEGLTVKPPGKPTLAPESSPKPEFKVDSISKTLVASVKQLTRKAGTK